MIKLIALDRDGVVNEDSPSYIKSLEEWHTVPGSMKAIAKLKQLGYLVVIATNQSGIARGLFTLDTLKILHQKMLAEIEEAGGQLDGIFICPHAPEDLCECRKPKPGLLLQAANKFNVEPQEILMIGDSTRDMLAAKNCGAKAIFIKTAHKTSDLLAAQKEGVPIYESLAAAVDYICTPSSVFKNN